MESGFAIENGMRSIKWIQGVPERSWVGGVKLNDRDCRPIVIWRCIDCGFLEAYARELTSVSGLT
jgi:hypothetical protein